MLNHALLFVFATCVVSADSFDLVIIETLQNIIYISWIYAIYLASSRVGLKIFLQHSKHFEVVNAKVYDETTASIMSGMNGVVKYEIINNKITVNLPKVDIREFIHALFIVDIINYYMPISINNTIVT